MKSGHLYAMLFSNGLIKVGRASAPEARMDTHECRVAVTGLTVVERYSVECTTELIVAERLLINRCAAVASQQNKGEWFFGLDLSLVKTWMSEAVSAAAAGDFEPSVGGGSGVARSVCTLTAAERADVAEKVGCNEQYLYQCLTGRRDMDAADAVRVEYASEGKVSRLQLRQTDGHLIWADLHAKRLAAQKLEAVQA